MKISAIDEKIITLLDLSIDRSEITDGISSILERLKLYFENESLMERIDSAEVLLRDLEEFLNIEYQSALEQIEEAVNENLLTQLNKLSEAGRDAYWTNGKPELTSVRVEIPWRD